MTVTAEMYRSRVADVLNLTTDNDRLRSELQRITDIAKASTTANSLPNIAKIASDALAGASVPAPQPPVEGLVAELRFASEGLHLPPSIQSQRNIRAMDAMDKAATILAALASPSLTAGQTLVPVQVPDQNSASGYRIAWLPPAPATLIEQSGQK